MKKFYVYHACDDSYIKAEEASLTPGGELCFVIDGKLIASFAREKWTFFKEEKEE